MSESGKERGEWDESWARICEMELGVDDPLPEFQRTVNAMMERLGNDIGRPLVMKVTVEVHEGELADPGGESETEEYAGGSVVTEQFDRLWELDEAFGELLREHDLDYVEVDRDD